MASGAFLRYALESCSDFAVWKDGILQLIRQYVKNENKGLKNQYIHATIVKTRQGSELVPPG